MKHVRNSSKTCSVHVHLDSNIQHPVSSIAIKISDLEINHIYLPQKSFNKRLLWSPKHNPHGHMCLLAVLAGEQKCRVPALSLHSLLWAYALSLKARIEMPLGSFSLLFINLFSDKSQ